MTDGPVQTEKKNPTISKIPPLTLPIAKHSLWQMLPKNINSQNIAVHHYFSVNHSLFWPWHAAFDCNIHYLHPYKWLHISLNLQAVIEKQFLCRLLRAEWQECKGAFECPTVSLPGWHPLLEWVPGSHSPGAGTSAAVSLSLHNPLQA